MVHNIADVTPNSAAVALSVAHTKCNWIALSAPTGNAGDIRYGDSTTGSGSGALLKAGTTIILPPIGDALYLDLALTYVYGTSTDKVGVLYGTH